ncbi:MAG: tetratricopeptide repeat protein [Gammaproteobacteria bacterium]|nr:tetratricopeptide repeat protein [Gammaproteobacteria bacterium]
MLLGRVKIVVLGLCLAIPFNFALAQSSDDFFQAGVTAATAGEYQQALVEFKKARRTGMSTPALKYNLAVAYYRTGQYEQARLIYVGLSNDPSLEQLAYFNLGLIANKQKKSAASIRWFRRAYRHAGDSRSSQQIRTLAATALKRLGTSGTRVRQNRKWSVRLSTALASDSNVTLANDELVGVTRQSDTYMGFSANGGKWLKGRGDQGVRLTLGANLQQYDKLGENDFARLQVGMARYDLLGRWEMRFAGGWDEIYFSGSEYQRVIGVEVRGHRDLPNDRQLRLRYALGRIQATDAVFDYLDGWRQQARVAIRQRRGGNTLRAYYQLEVNDRQDRVGTIEPFSSYSPTRHSLRLTSGWRYSNGWRLRLDGRYRYSLYGGRNELTDGTRIRRADKQFRVSARVSWRVARHWGVSAGYYFTTNDSNIGRKSYDRSLIKLGLSWNY